MKNKTPDLKLIQGGKKEFDFKYVYLILPVLYFICIAILVYEAY